MKVYSLDWDDDDPVFDFKLIGFASSLVRDYDFVFYLNKNCRFNFSRIKDQEITEDGILYAFSAYRFYHLKTRQEIELISNYSFPQTIKENTGLFGETEVIKTLIPEHRSFNYFLKSDFLLDEEFYTILPNLESIREYQKISINSIKMKNLENLILPT
ncbi:MAG: IPExxxVDY family protein [Flavobacteriaceae bacterium]|jgi:hypothetical protein|nr:IPExxxVDY family protein [Flavobacteriaceae bacterium]